MAAHRSPVPVEPRRAPRSRSTANVVSVAAPPMEGLRVTAVSAATGARVRAGDALLELEDARSLYELAAPVAGVVHEVLVEEGDAVVASAVLVRLRLR